MTDRSSFSQKATRARRALRPALLAAMFAFGLSAAHAAELPLAALKRLELARALAIEPRLLLLDEVLAGLTPSELTEVLPLIRAIRARGTTIILIEHVMQAVMTLCEEIHVLAHGRMIAQGPPQLVCEDPAVIEAYLGHGTASRLREGAHA